MTWTGKIDYDHLIGASTLSIAEYDSTTNRRTGFPTGEQQVRLESETSSAKLKVPAAGNGDGYVVELDVL
ncbi:hypothetical protein WFJ45_22270, partial [Salmonella enterica subsp. enterica serovar Minnesota]|uniref:hypothetical protein n=1 Tax=Salmonella enterica TaxID=28901 RepID=UPI003D269C28